MRNIGFNKPYLTGNELKYIKQAVEAKKISGDGLFSKKCQAYFEKRYGFKKCLLTTSCTDALEMAAILINIQPGDEVIMPSYTFVSTANAFILRGARIVFADSRKDHPGIDEDKLMGLITEKTKAIVPVHYAGVACDMDKIMDLADAHGLYVVEDAAQAIDGYYTGRSGVRQALGSIGHLAAFSFHETKNIIAGEGGMLAINDERFCERAEIIWEKGTNRASFFRGEVDTYGWKDIGSSFLPSDINAAFLWAQIENLETIQKRRWKHWNTYDRGLSSWFEENEFSRPKIPPYSTNNAHIFYFCCNNVEQRDDLIRYLRTNGIIAIFHYLSLHKSSFYFNKHDGRQLTECDRYSETLIRLPLYFDLTMEELDYIIDQIILAPV